MIRKLISRIVKFLFILLFLIYFEFVLRPFVYSLVSGSELVSSVTYWPTGNNKVAGLNGSGLVFRLNDHKIRYVDADMCSDFCDYEYFGGNKALYESTRSTGMPPVIATWSDLFEITENKKSNQLSISINEFVGDRFIEKKIYFDDFIYPVSISDNYLIAREEFVQDSGVPISLIVELESREIVKDIRFRGVDVVAALDVGILGIVKNGEQSKIYVYGGKAVDGKLIYSGRDPSLWALEEWSYSDGLIAFSDYVDGSRRIVVCDLKSDKFVVFGSESKVQKFPFLYGGKVFWSELGVDYSDNYSIYISDIDSKNKHKLDISGDATRPVYFDGYLYWTVSIESLFGIEDYIFREKINI